MFPDEFSLECTTLLTLSHCQIQLCDKSVRCADVQECGCPSSSDIIVIQVLNLATRVAANCQVHQDALAYKLNRNKWLDWSNPRSKTPGSTNSPGANLNSGTGPVGANYRDVVCNPSLSAPYSIVCRGFQTMAAAIYRHWKKTLLKSSCKTKSRHR